MKGDRLEMCFSGSGGQGVILASVIFAEAAVLEGLRTVQSQAYGPEARGGSSRAETIISKNDIWFSKIGSPDFLLALTQTALDKFSGTVKAGGTILADASLDVSKCPSSARVVTLPVIGTAASKVGKAVTTNIVAVGAINGLLGLFPEETMEKAVLLRVPKGTETLNAAALREGAKLAGEPEAAE